MEKVRDSIPGRFSRGLVRAGILSGLVLAAASLQGATVALYDFPTSAGTALPSASTDIDPDSIASALSVGPGPTTGISSTAGDPVNSLFLRGLDNSTEANAFAGNKYIAFTITPVSGTLSFSSLSFDYRRDTSTSAANFALYASTGSFVSGDHLLTGTLSNVSGTTFSHLSLDLSGILSLQDVSSAITFRLYLWGAGEQTALTRFDNVSVTTAVPEPGAGILLSGGVILLGLFRWHRRFNPGRM